MGIPIDSRSLSIHKAQKFLTKTHLRDTHSLTYETMSIIFRQLQCNTSKTFTYFLGCPKTKETVIIDPVDNQVDRDAQMLKELGLEPKYAINTHCHADHVTGTDKLKAHFPNIRSVISFSSGAMADLHLEQKDSVSFGEFKLDSIATPGHTSGCTTFISQDLKAVFSGDTLMIRKCGRTDFQEGCPEQLYESVYNHIFSLDDDFVIWPGHDYSNVDFL